MAIVAKGLVFIATTLLLFAAYTVYLIGQPLFGVIITIVALGFLFVFGMRRFYFARFIYPGIATMALFVIFPIFYTIYLGFTNYGSFNLLTFQRVQEVLQSTKIVDKSTAIAFAVAADGNAYRIYFERADGGGFLSETVALDGSTAQVGSSTVDAAPSDLLARRDAIKLRKGLAEISVTLPNGTELRNAGLREFASVTPEYKITAEGTATRVTDGMVFQPDHVTGFYTNAEGEQLNPAVVMPTRSNASLEGHYLSVLVMVKVPFPLSTLVRIH